MRRKIIPYNSKLKELAKRLRNDSTPGEILLWKELSNRQMYGYDFHRQKPLLNYIVDFYCYELDLVIEIDGQYHSWEEKFLADELRDKELEAYKLTILRFTEQDVKNNMVSVLRAIENHILEYDKEKVNNSF